MLIGVIAYIMMLQSDNKANANIIQSQDAVIAKLKTSNEAEVKTTNELRRQLKYHESLAITRQKTQESIDVATVNHKQELNILLKESDNEQDIVWAAESIPDDVISMLIETTGSGYSNTNYKNYPTSEFNGKHQNSDVFRNNQSGSNQLYF